MTSGDRSFMKSRSPGRDTRSGPGTFACRRPLVRSCTVLGLQPARGVPNDIRSLTVFGVGRVRREPGPLS